MKTIGRICEIMRYPVKSMAGVAAASANLGWHGLAGDRRYAFRLLGEKGGFPWLSASRCPELVLYHPCNSTEAAGEPVPTAVRTPDGRILDLNGSVLQREISERVGGAVELMRFKHGIFDDATASAIGLATIAEISRAADVEPDRRRFRANFAIETFDGRPFAEDEWVGGTMKFGDSDSGPAVVVTSRDVRCSMINLDPDTAAPDVRVIKAVVELNENNAGVYGTVVQTGQVHVGDLVHLLCKAWQ